MVRTPADLVSAPVAVEDIVQVRRVDVDFAIIILHIRPPLELGRRCRRCGRPASCRRSSIGRLSGMRGSGCGLESYAIQSHEWNDMHTLGMRLTRALRDSRIMVYIICGRHTPKTLRDRLQATSVEARRHARELIVVRLEEGQTDETQKRRIGGSIILVIDGQIEVSSTAIVVADLGEASREVVVVDLKHLKILQIADLYRHRPSNAVAVQQDVLQSSKITY
jgi:hypothetical protein